MSLCFWSIITIARTNAGQTQIFDLKLVSQLTIDDVDEDCQGTDFVSDWLSGCKISFVTSRIVSGSSIVGFRCVESC